MDGAAFPLGRAIKRYVAAKWRGPGNDSEIALAARSLAPAIRDRIDALGLDDHVLLAVPDDGVLETIARLEAETDI